MVTKAKRNVPHRRYEGSACTELKGVSAFRPAATAALSRPPRPAAPAASVSSDTTPFEVGAKALKYTAVMVPPQSPSGVRPSASLSLEGPEPTSDVT